MKNAPAHRHALPGWNFTCDRIEARYIHRAYLCACREMIRHYLDSLRRGSPDGRWLNYAREKANDARLWAEKLGVHFGIESNAQKRAREEAFDQRQAQLATPLTTA